MSHPCPHCDRLAVRRPPAWGPLVVALAWVFVAAMLFLASLIGPFIMFLAPVVFAFGASAVTCAHDLAFADPECEACGKVVFAAAPAPAARPAVRVVARAA